MKSKIVIYNNFTASAAERRGAVADLVSGLELLAAGSRLPGPVLVVAGKKLSISRPVGALCRGHYLSGGL